MNKFEVGLITTSPYAQVMRSRIWTMSCTNCCGDGLKDGTQRRTSGGFPRDTGIVSVIGTGCSLRKKRKFDKGMHRLTGKFKMIWKNQNGLCYHCGMPMDVTEEREIFYLAPKAKAGMEDVRNMRYVHCTCQRIYAENRLKK